MGEHRLRDLNRPETVFQLLHPDLPADFPPLKSLDYLPTNLPLQLTSFIGRETEIDAVKGLLAKTKLLTLTGSGGCGKTRLALQVAADLIESFSDGIWLVELAALSDPALVPQQVATVLKLREEPGRTLLQTISDSLQSKALLLLLDNCEHLLSACATLSDTLLKSCPQVRLLATGREALGLLGEQVYRVPSLFVPDPQQLPREEKELATIVSEYEAVHLFVERARLQDLEFVLTRHNAEPVASVCHRLDGIPLAIELAAARVRSLSVEEINTRLEDRFRLLTGAVARRCLVSRP
jgi:predicted ATPase